MKYSDFEKQIGDKLRNEEIQLDTAAFYKTLTAKKRKKRGAIIILFPLLFVLGIVGFYGMSTNNAASTLANHDKIYGTGEKNNTSLNTQMSLNDYTTNDIDNSDLVNQQLVSASKSEMNVVSNPNSFTENQNTKTIPENNTPSQINKTSNNTTKAINTGKSKNVQSYINSQSLQSNNNQNTSFIEIAHSQNQVNSQISKNQVSNTKNIDNSLQNYSLENQLNINSIATLFPSVLFESEKLPILNKIDCPDFRVNKKIFDIELLGEVGYFRPIKKFDPTTVNSTEVNVLRTQNEASREGYHAAIYAKLIGRIIPIYFQTGLSQDFLTERMSIEYSYIERDTTQGIISITESENGDTITAIIGDIIKETEISGNKIKHYQLQMIDIPLIAGYQFNFNRFTLGVEAGALFNIRMRSNGKILAAKTNFEDVETQNPFKSSVGMSYLGGISLGYHLSPRSKIYLNTKMRFIPDAINMGGNTLTQKYKFLGLNVGYGYLF